MTTIHHDNKRKANQGLLYMRTPSALSWRLDPDESLSDWTISVESSLNLEHFPKYYNRYHISDNCGELNDKARIAPTKVYFVHRAQLAVGPRRSEFFVNVFKRIAYPSPTSGEHRDDSSFDKNGSWTDHRTVIDLIPKSASCFPIMLDYIYSGNLSIDTTTAVALRQLASSFGVREMFRETTNFIKSDMGIKTVTIYLVEAIKFKNAKVQSTSMNLIATNFLDIKLTGLVCIPPLVMSEILQSAGEFVSDKEKFSSRIASYCRCREEELTLMILDSITSKNILSSIDFKESLYFLHLLHSLKAKEKCDKEKCDQNLEMMNLYQISLVQVPRFLKTLLNTKSLKLNNTAQHKTRKYKHDLELYQSLPADVKVYILEQMFGSSSSPSPEVNNGTRMPSYNEKKTRKEMIKLQNEVKLLKVSYDKKVHYFKRLLDAKVDELEKLKS